MDDMISRVSEAAYWDGYEAARRQYDPGRIVLWRAVCFISGLALGVLLV